jgi:FMN phosphatase YigB (HAD superfamily)
MNHDRYLVWDFDGTLGGRRGGWRGTMQELLERELPGVVVDMEAMRPSLRRGFPWHEPEVIREPCTADAWWASLHGRFVEALQCGARIDEARAMGLARRVRDVFFEPTAWSAYDDVAPVLDRLSGAGWRHIILSNHVPELTAVVRGLGLADRFVRIYTSGEMGIEKPNPAAYHHVFADYPSARDGWMIGDNWIADVQGARAVGMRSMLVRKDHPEADLRFETLYGVAELLESG